MCSSCPYSPLMCSWLPERPWCLMQFSCPVVSIRIEFQRGVLKDTERLKAPVLLDGTCCVPLENQSASLICLARKSVAQPTSPRSKNHTFCLMRARPRLRWPLHLPACAGPHAFPLEPYALPPAPALTRSRLRLTASAFSTIFSFHSSSGASS